ncbi:DNA mismatch repair protein MutS [Candidatus Woesearchaeota archaeon]|nr:DNA mismatch repair protein MutS [Candidatus Woesearchaeota archaeon]
MALENNSTKSVLDLETDALTPGMKQYQEVKKAHPDCLVMLRMGDFYEMFYEDAVTASKELEITLTARGKGDKRAPLAGVPFHALESYLGRLVKKGYKVAIVEQLEDPKLAKGLVKRGLVRIVTPGTVIESSMLNEKENNYVACIRNFNIRGSENIASDQEEFVAAFCDISTGDFFSITLDGEQALLSELSRFNPSECVLPASLLVNQELVSKIKILGSFVNPFEDYFFRSEKALETLQQHFPSLDGFGLSEKNLIVCGALMKYLLETQKNNLSHLQKITLRSNQSKMLLDQTTLRNLELTKNIRDGTARGTLLSVVDKTSTPLGARRLRQWLKEPLLNLQAIEARLQAVEELNQEILIRAEIQEFLKQVQDLERLTGRINYGNANPRDLLSLKNSLLQIPLLKEKIESFKSSLLVDIQNMSSFEELNSIIVSAICDDAPFSLREGGMIKEGYNLELDQLHSIKRNSRKYLQELEEKEKQKTGISTLHLGYTKVFGYFIEITKRNLHLVPQYYIRKQTTANSERYITEELKVGINALEYELFQDLVRRIVAKTIELQDTASKIAVLDVLVSFSQVALENNYCRPTFVEDKLLRLKSSRHPVVEKRESHFVVNDIILEKGEMMIITGPNMAGKSTIMRQAALIVLLAQMGSFVPAEEAVLGLVDRIFTRVGAFDDLSSGQSTFMVEMQETAAILNNATSDSLIILDEIGRGTSTFDGVSIAWAVAEHIYNNIKAKTLFATHYHALNKLAEKFPRVKNYNVAVKEVKNEIILLHKLVPGGTDQSHGVHVAKLAGLPLDVVNRASEIQNVLEQDDEIMRKLKVKKLEEQKSLEGF